MREQQPQTAHHRALFVVAACALVVIGLLAWGRLFLTFGTETDLLSTFVPEARRLLLGQPLSLGAHPPFYPITLAALRSVGVDWFAAGRLLSWVGAGVCLLTGPLVLGRLYGRAAAAGAVVALVGSGTFVTLSAMATSDVFSLALLYGAIFTFLRAGSGQGRTPWFIAGIFLGLSLLTRANAISFLMLLVFPLVSARPWRYRGKTLVVACLGCLTPLALWFGFAGATGSALWPQAGLRANLALTYFADSGEGVGSDALGQMLGRFDSVTDVLLYDPGHLVRTYLRDLANGARRIVSTGTLIEFPLNLLALPGVLLLGLRSRSPASRLFLICIAAQVALVNLKTFGPRFYLFLLPVLGAGVGLMFAELYGRSRRGWPRATVAALFVLAATVSATQAVRESRPLLHAQDDELRAAVRAASVAVTPETCIIARKPHMGFYAGVERIRIGSDTTPEGLRERISATLAERPVLLYVGSVERARRPTLTARLVDPQTAPPWLVPIAQGSEAGGWVLYRFDVSTSTAEPGTR